jgi:hypothetical protein
MNETEKERLLNDLLRDDSYTEFRGELFERMRGKMRQARALRKASKLLAWAACVTIAIGLLSHRDRTAKPSAAISIVEEIRTVPLRLDQVVTTATLKGEATFSELQFVSTPDSNVEVIYTVSGSLEKISDEELLELFKGQSVVLVHTGPNRRQLIFPGGGVE